MTEPTAAPVSNRFRLTIGLCTTVFVYGVLIALPGVVEKSLADKFNLLPSQTGNFPFFIFTPTVIMLFLTGLLLDKLGKKVMIVGGSFMVVVALWLIGNAESYSTLLIAMAMLGAGGGGINGGCNTMINDLYPENPGQAMNRINVFTGLGMVSFPLIAAGLLATQGLSALTWVTMILCMVSVVYMGLARFPAPGPSEHFDFTAAKRAVGTPLVMLFTSIMFFYIALEVSTGMWANRFLQVAHGQTESTALLLVAGFWVWFLLGRVIAGQLLKTMPDTVLLIGAIAGSGAGLALMALAPNAGLAIAGLWLAGLCYGPVFPTTLGTAGSIFKDTFGTVMGVTIGIGIIGSMILPKIIGSTWDDLNPSKAIWYLFVFAVPLFITQVLVHRQVAAQSESDAE
jgi:fucose permease